MASTEREPITGVWKRSRPPYPSPCKNSSDLYQFYERPLANVGWTCPPQTTPWRRHCSYILICDVNSHFAFSYVNQQVLRLTEVFSYLYTIHLYLSSSRSIDGGLAFFHPCEIWSCVFQSYFFHPRIFHGPAFSIPAFSASPLSCHISATV